MRSYKKIQEEPKMVNATLHEESISGRALQILVTIRMVSIMIIEMTKKKKKMKQFYKLFLFLVFLNLALSKI